MGAQRRQRLREDRVVAQVPCEKVLQGLIGGVAGWSSLARQVLPPFAATYSDPARALGRVTLRRGLEVIVRLAQPALVQVDGELLAPTRALRARLDAGAILMRRPA